MSEGILLVAYGDKYLKELEVCRPRIEAVWPDVTIHVETGPEAGHPRMLPRIDAIRNSPFERTIYMDVDCWLVEAMPDLFELLTDFDLALPHAVYREVYPVDAPPSFPEHCPGLMVWRKNKKTRALFDDWRRRFLRDHASRYDERKVSWFPTQPSFREALFHSDARFAVLPPEYHWTGIGYVQNKVKLVHKRPNAEGEAERINANAGEQRVATIWDLMVMRW